MSWRRLVVRRQQKTVQGEEDFLLHHSTVSIHTGHTCLKTESEECAERLLENDPNACIHDFYHSLTDSVGVIEPSECHSICDSAHDQALHYLVKTAIT